MAQGTLGKKEQQDSKSQRIEEFVVRLFVLGLSEAAP